jgi:hypothetical protein
MIKKIIKGFWIGMFFVATGLILFAPMANAEELKEGTVITAANLDEMKSKTFEGKTIESMLSPMLETWIRDWALKMPLRHSEPMPVDERWIALTKKHSGQVKLDSASREISGFTAGCPFPAYQSCFGPITDAAVNDPDAALKVVWNASKNGGYPRGDLQWVPEFEFIFIDADKGVERAQTWAFIVSHLQGRLQGETTLDPIIYKKNPLFAVRPYDIAGLGTFTIRYSDGRKDNVWAYLRNFRRTRRLSGGAWMDPIGGTDLLQDEKEVLDINPTWYKSYKLIGKRHVLAICHSKRPSIDRSLKGQEAYIGIDHANFPHWNPVDAWEPREVWVIEAIMPKEHVYSRKVMYMDAQIPLPLFGEAYDHKGNPWKLNFFGMTPIKGGDGGWGVLSNSGHTLDFKRRHGTVFLHPMSSVWNKQGVNPDDISVHMLEQAAGRKFK